MHRAGGLTRPREVSRRAERRVSAPLAAKLIAALDSIPDPTTSRAGEEDGPSSVATTRARDELLGAGSLELLGGVYEVAVAHDVIAAEHAGGLVAAQLHGDVFRDSGPHEVPHGGTP